MTGIFSNDTYNNGVTRDNFDKYVHTYYNPRDPYNSDYLPPVESGPKIPSNKKPYSNNNKGNKKAGILGAIIFIAIIIFIVSFSLKMYYTAQEINYYQSKADDAKDRIAQLEGGLSGYFILSSSIFLPPPPQQQTTTTHFF